VAGFRGWSPGPYQHRKKIIKMTRKRAVLILLAATAVVCTVAASAFACTIFRGTFTIKGNASTASVTATGLRTGMVQTVSSGIAKANATGGSVTVSTGADQYGVKLPANSYLILFYNSTATAPGYSDHTHWANDCMAGSPGAVTLGTVSVGADGRIAGQPRTFALPSALRKDTAPKESATCISNSAATYGNQAPLTIL
jgi:hypothetical protein